MRILAIDIGSSAVRAAILSGRERILKIARVEFETIFDGPRAEVDASSILNALSNAIAQLGGAIRTVDLIVPAVMSPSWVALDKNGRVLTRVITHQDRRSVEQAMEIERVVGRRRHLRLTGNRPIPGGISSTTWLWHLQRMQSQMRRAKIVGHLNTMLAHLFTGNRVTDPSNASFMGLYATTSLSGWSDELIGLIGVDRAHLPEIMESNCIVGTVTPGASEKFGITMGTPMLAGITDGSCAMLLAGARPGQLVNICGSTDVLALCVDHARPHDDFLTRALGVGPRWLAVQTIAAAGHALDWVWRTFYSEMSRDDFFDEVKNQAKGKSTEVQFDSRLAGSRISIQEIRASISHLTLGSTRQNILRSLLNDLAKRSAERIERLKTQHLPIKSEVVVSGGTNALTGVMQRDWPRRFRFHNESNATLRGLWVLAENARR